MYKLTVTAYDCGKNRASEDVLVKISIKPTCKPSWQGIKASARPSRPSGCVSTRSAAPLNCHSILFELTEASEELLLFLFLSFALCFLPCDVICNPFHSASRLLSDFIFAVFVSQASTKGLNTSPAQAAWLCSPAFTWRLATSQSRPSKPALNWKPTTSGRAATGTPTLRNLYISCAVRGGQSLKHASNLRPVGQMWPNKSFYVVCESFREIRLLILVCSSTGSITSSAST